MDKKPSPEIHVRSRNLKDLIRDEIYGAALKKVEGVQAAKGTNIICLEMAEVDKIAKRIAKRAMIGPT